MSFPWNDWQFYCVTSAAIWGGWIVVRQLLPSKDEKNCPGCASGSAAQARKPASSSGFVTIGDRG